MASPFVNRPGSRGQRSNSGIPFVSVMVRMDFMIAPEFGANNFKEFKEGNF